MEHTYLENKSHGTSFYPLQVYSHADKNGFILLANIGMMKWSGFMSKRITQYHR